MAHELGDQAELQQVFGQDVLQHLADVLLLLGLDGCAEAQHLLARAAFNDLVDAREGPAADEEDVGGVDLEALLLGVLAAALGRHVGDRALQDLQQRLLDPFAGYVPGDGHVLAFACDLVDLVDVDDAALGPWDVVIRGLDEL